MSIQTQAPPEEMGHPAFAATIHGNFMFRIGHSKEAIWAGLSKDFLLDKDSLVKDGFDVKPCFIAPWVEENK